MNFEFLESEIANFTGLVMAITVAVAALTYTFLAGKMHGKTAALRKLSFRCVAATLMRPNRGFRIGVALVGIGFMFVAYYRVLGESSPETVRIVVSGGMFLTVVSSAGLAVYRMLHSHTKAAFAAFAEAPTPNGS